MWTLLSIVQDEVAAIPVFAPNCTAPMFDDGIVSATIDCSATANVQDPHTAKRG